MLPDAVVAVVIVLGVGALLFQGVALYLAARMPQLERLPLPMPTSAPKVTVVIAARNEEGDLPECLDDLHRQQGVDLEIVVVDGASTDRSREVVEARSDFVRLLREPPLPSGWVGKSWALTNGAQATTGEWILFTDADMRYHPTTVARTVGWAVSEKADLVSLAAPTEMQGFWQNVVLPFYVQMVLTYFRAPRVNHDASRTAVANGQFTLVRRASYEAVGGHAAVRGFVLEDVALAQRFRAAGLRLRIAWAADLLTTRMYRGGPEMYEGLLKHVHGVRFAAWRQAWFLVGLVGGFLLPLLVLPVGILTHTSTLTVLGAVLVVALFAKHAAFTRATRGHAAYGLLFPLAVGYYVVLVTHSLVRGARGLPIVWKGRDYPLLR